MADIPLFSGFDFGGGAQKGGPQYYKERNFKPCPQFVRLSPARPKLGYAKTSHAELTALGVPRRKDGNKLGLRKRRLLLAWF